MYTFIHPIFILTDSTGNNKLNNLEFEQCDISEKKMKLQITIQDYILVYGKQIKSNETEFISSRKFTNISKVKTPKVELDRPRPAWLTHSCLQ